MSLLVNVSLPTFAGSAFAVGAMPSAVMGALPTTTSESSAGEFVPPAANAITRRNFSKLLAAGGLGMILFQPRESHATTQPQKNEGRIEETAGVSENWWGRLVGSWGFGAAAFCGDILVRGIHSEILSNRPNRYAWLLSWPNWFTFHLGFNSVWIFPSFSVPPQGAQFISRKNLSPPLDLWARYLFHLGLWGTFETGVRLFLMDWWDTGQARVRRAFSADYGIHVLKAHFGTLLYRFANGLLFRKFPSPNFRAIYAMTIFPIVLQAWLTYRQIQHRDR